MIEARTLWSLVEARAEATPGALFAIDEAGRRVDFATLRREGERVAAGLREAGVRPGDVVAWLLPTRIDAFVLMIALRRLGAIQNPLVPIYGPREIGFALDQTGARWLLVPGMLRGTDFAGLARDLAEERPALRVLELADGLPAADPETIGLPRPEDDGEAVRWIFYTSGTTSDPKGASHTDASILLSSRGLAEAIHLRPGARTGVVFPVTHLGGANALFSTLIAGSTQLVVERFAPETTVPFLARHAVTHVGAGPAFYQAYVDYAQGAGVSPVFPAVEVFYGGGAPTTPALRAAVARAFGGVPVLSTYGMTECPVITMARWDDPPAKREGTEGRPTVAGTRIRIVDAGGRAVAPGVEGEVRVDAPQRLAGFVDPALDRDAFDEEGFFRTGDLGRVDAEGYLTITGRIKDVIIRKGENISALEVESLLAEHPAVAEVAVVGLPDATRGELCCAVVRATDPETPITLAEITRYLEARGLARRKIPERLELVDTLPRNTSGKVLKTALIARYGARDGGGAIGNP